MSTRPLVIAANRLPVQRSDDGWTTSPGGLVRALAPLLRQRGGTWVGWAGESDVPDRAFDADGITLEPVPISDDEHRLYYEGFANDTLWPLYHDAIRESGYHNDEWESYVTVNQRFADRLAQVAPPNALVWIHDYQLQLVPQMLRDQRDDVRIGWFNHIPFPPLELFQRLPSREEIARGLLGADVIGFQRARDAYNFRAAATDLTGARSTDDYALICDGRRIIVDDFPISIDVSEFEHLASGRATRRTTAELRNRLGDPEVVLLGVDRLDYTKGIGTRLRAFGQLLDEGRLDPSRHVLVQVATPTREGVEQYQEERREIEQIVGEINGRHSRIGLPVVHYLYRTLPLDDLIALYRVGDVMLVTPFRDGMNLVAKEYVAAHVDGDGVLVLSEFTGAADELHDALLVNPHDDQALQDAIVRAVEMHRHERRPRMKAMRAAVTAADLDNWAGVFLQALDQ
ncbi:MAG: trehalose-6-phosphate synthase [Ilumatobacter coccineus]|uniref:Trehalose-6-phosphate synthase n=1 Tax=Ilumatobacter coccineus TaxID=467094 RepID=A0A2G6KFK0_9ACTN|nr:MAG: trehalose-6-phosphate synthase [Ilumatobacter coccineus]